MGTAAGRILAAALLFLPAAALADPAPDVLRGDNPARAAAPSPAGVSEAPIARDL